MFVDRLGRRYAKKPSPPRLHGKQHPRFKHGQRGTRTYRAWQAMLNRCRNPNVENFEWYGGRGISVTPRWTVFANFLTDMGPCPQGHELDRRHSGRGYSKHNCRWVTRAVNALNKSTTRWITIDGTTRALCVWLKRFDLVTSTFYRRLARGWSVKRALTTPPRKAAS